MVCENMVEWKSVKVKQELVEMAERAVEAGQYPSLSEFVSEAVRNHLDALKQTREEKVVEKPEEHPIVYERLLYSTNHVWAMVTPDGNVKIGLSDYAQRRLNGITHLQSKQVWSEVKKEEPLGMVETWMFKFELRSPISGKIVEINKALLNEPSIINKDPYELGWIAKIEPDNTVKLEEELRELMRPTQYKTWASKLDHPKLPKP
jgi:glycine cleavage system H protein